MKTILSFFLVASLLLAGCDQSHSTSDQASAQTDTLAFADSVANEPAKPEPIVSANTHWFSQKDLFRNENSDVVNTMTGENYAAAYTKATTHLAKPNLSETQLANLRYMQVYALAGQASEGKKKHAEVKKLLESYIGQNFVSQHLEITKGGGMPFNQIQVKQDTEGVISVTCANSMGFNILCFVRVKMLEYPDLSQHLGERGYLGGKLGSFKVSAQDINSWIVDMDWTDGFISYLEGFK